MFDFSLGVSLIGFAAAFVVPVHGLVAMTLVAAIGGSTLAGCGGATLTQVLVRCLLSMIFIQVGYALGLFSRAGLTHAKGIGSLGTRLRLRAATDARKKR